MTPETPGLFPAIPPAGAVLIWSAGDPAPAVPLAVAGKAMTLALRLGGPRPAAGEIVRWQGKNGRAVVRMAFGPVGAKPGLVVEVGMDVREKPLQLGLPLSALEEGKAAVIVLRFADIKLELFADGVLVDEEWPLGSLAEPEGRLQLGTAAQGVALWARGLGRDEVIRFSGDAAGLEARATRMLGPERPVGQGWKPRGFNANLGDCMPFFHAGRFHLFYLFNRRRHGSRWGLGGHEWWHLSTTDLIHWEKHPIAVPLTREDEGSMCTGSVFFHAGTYYAFYAVRMEDLSPSPLCGSTSPDGIHFTKHPALARPKPPYKTESARDPVVFRDPGTGLFHMLVTTSLLNDPSLGENNGCLAHLVSRDLKDWEQQGPFLLPGLPGEPECPDFFEWHGWFYLLFSHQGVTYYRMSRRPLGPWTKPETDTFGGPAVMVMKTAAYPGDRRLGAAFTREPEGYGGTLVIREIVQNADGTLATKWPAELPP